MAEAASVCLESQGHGLVVDLTVDGVCQERFVLERLQVGEQMRNAHRNEERTTENGAYGVAILAVCRLTRQTVLHQSWRWTGFDYWLIPEYEVQFQEAMFLEISGIRKGTEGKIRARAREKIIQLQSYPLPELVRRWAAIVEFSRPHVRIVEP